MNGLAEPTLDAMERRLQAWGAWRGQTGSADGYPSKSVLHPTWSPPSAGTTPTLHAARRGDGEERAMDGHIGSLSVKLRDAVFLRYVKRMPDAAMAQSLGCQQATARARVVEAKRQLGVLLRGGFTS